MQNHTTENRPVGLLAAALLVVGVGVVSAPETARASGGTDVGVGLRLGGPGFEQGHYGWDRCCMNPTGLFVTLDFPSFVFTEFSAEYYQASGSTLSGATQRSSLYLLASLGARIFPGGLITPYVQAGVGPEFTRIEDRDRDYTGMLAAPFAGVGTEINLWSLRLGVGLRTYMVGTPDRQATLTTSSGGSQRVRDIDYHPATEMKFSVRWVF